MQLGAPVRNALHQEITRLKAVDGLRIFGILREAINGGVEMRMELFRDAYGDRPELLATIIEALTRG